MGFPVYAGQTYGWKIVGVERDEVSADDEMGDLIGLVDQDMGWGIGTWTERGWRGGGDGVLGFCVRSGPTGCHRAHFTAEYEVRHALLPDLEPTKIEIVELPGSTEDVVCMSVLNRGVKNPGPFEMTLRAGPDVLRNGTVSAGGLPSGDFGVLCTGTDLPTSGQHQLSVTVDERRIVPENNETNNRFGQPYVAARVGSDAGPVGGLDGNTLADPGPTGPTLGLPSVRPPGPVSPSVPQPGLIKLPDPDLQVGPVEVTSSNDGGRCEARGRNLVAVTIQNTGDASTGAFAVEAKVGNQQRGRTTVGGLASSSEMQVEIQEVGISQGEGSLQVIVDPDNTVIEASETNNARTVELDCISR